MVSLYYECRDVVKKGHLTVVVMSPCGGRLEYLHHSPASHKRRQRVNQVVPNEEESCGHESCGTRTQEFS
jgi:hypothetical protein